VCTGIVANGVASGANPAFLAQHARTRASNEARRSRGSARHGQSHTTTELVGAVTILRRMVWAGSTGSSSGDSDPSRAGGVTVDRGLFGRRREKEPLARRNADLGPRPPEQQPSGQERVISAPDERLNRQLRERWGQVDPSVPHPCVLNPFYPTPAF
jgi:hypothetical protein